MFHKYMDIYQIYNGHSAKD